VNREELIEAVLSTPCMCGEVMEVMELWELETYRARCGWEGVLALGHACRSCGMAVVSSPAALWAIEPAPSSRVFKRVMTKRDRFEAFRLCPR
jgi:hypothetical protein